MPVHPILGLVCEARPTLAAELLYAALRAALACLLRRALGRGTRRAVGRGPRGDSGGGSGRRAPRSRAARYWNIGRPPRGLSRAAPPLQPEVRHDHVRPLSGPALPGRLPTPLAPPRQA